MSPLYLLDAHKLLSRVAGLTADVTSDPFDKGLRARPGTQMHAYVLTGA